MLTQSCLKGMNRRRFLTGIVPVCALTCLGAKTALASMVLPYQEAGQTPGHKFDQPVDRPFTQRQISELRFRSYISLAKALEKEMGKDRMTRFIEEHTKAEMLAAGKAFAQRGGDNSFATFINLFRSPQLQNTLAMEIIEDTPKAFEIKVTECLAADTFKKAGALELGNAAVCIGDYTVAEGFNPRIKLIRDKTLTLGFPYCNHRYVWEG